MEDKWKQWQILFSLAPKSLQTVTAAMKFTCFSGKKSHDKPRQHIIKQKPHLADKSPYSQVYGFSSSHIWMWALDHKGDWLLKNWCFQSMVLDKKLESSFNSKEIKPVNPKGNRPWIFIGQTGTPAMLACP